MRRARNLPAQLAPPALSEADKALRAAARRQREARLAQAAQGAGEAREARHRAEAAASAAARSAAGDRALAGQAAWEGTLRRVRHHREAEGLSLVLPLPAPLPEEAALRAALARAAHPHTGVRLWSFGCVQPSRAAAPPVARSAVGLFLHAGVAVTVARGVPQPLPQPPRERQPGVADRPDGDRV